MLRQKCLYTLKKADVTSKKFEPLLLCIERSQLRWYGRVTRMLNEQTAKQLMDALLSDKRLRGRSRNCWRNYVEDLAWSRLEILPAKPQAGKAKYTKLIQCFP